MNFPIPDKKIEFCSILSRRKIEHKTERNEVEIVFSAEIVNAFSLVLRSVLRRSLTYKEVLSLADDLSEDLSLGLILDDKDDSVLGGGWSDEDEEYEDDFITPRHLPTLDENDDEFRRVPSRYFTLFENPPKKSHFTHCSKSSFFVQKFNFDFVRKLLIFWVRNS